MLEIYGQLNGLVMVVGGVYGLLLAYRVIPRKPKDPEKMEVWHRKFGTMMKILSPILIIGGVLYLLGVLRLT